MAPSSVKRAASSSEGVGQEFHSESSAKRMRVASLPLGKEAATAIDSSPLNLWSAPESVSGTPEAQHVSYSTGHNVIYLANRIFGNDGWSSTINAMSREIRQEASQWVVDAECRVCVTVHRGQVSREAQDTYHEAVGHGGNKPMLKRGDALEGAITDAQTEAETEAIKCALRSFEQGTGNCLCNTTTELRWQAEDTVARADRAQNLMHGLESMTVYDQMELFSFVNTCDKLAIAACTVGQTFVDNVVEYIQVLGNANETQKGIVTFFQTEVRNIVRTVSARAGAGSAVWKIVEECFNQSNGPDGALHLGRLDVDDSYAEASFQICERMEKDTMKRNDDWVAFWVRALQASPDGPTIYYPPAAHVEIGEHGPCPSKLFRTFDRKSSGINNDRLIASAMSQSHPARSRNDFLQLPAQEAKKELHYHLRKGTRTKQYQDRSDNFSSWTSSLLFAIQYAIYRCHKFSLSHSDVKICVVNPREFPQGQFMRDKGLIEAYWDPEEAKRRAYPVFNLRMTDPEYDNGEYLSQGRVSIKDRSCVVTLKQLVQSGLFELYPQLAEPRGRSKWTKRVKELRLDWSKPRPTTMREIEVALSLAKLNFPYFDAIDMALLLLAFKNRILNNTVHGERTADQPTKDGPAEVGRYQEVLRRVELIKKETVGPLTEDQILRDLFGCVNKINAIQPGI